ncbi:hypothetical protein BDV06DRAFT_173141 [Aspergillus oleicola]
MIGSASGTRLSGRTGIHRPLLLAFYRPIVRAFPQRPRNTSRVSRHGHDSWRSYLKSSKLRAACRLEKWILSAIQILHAQREYIGMQAERQSMDHHPRCFAAIESAVPDTAGSHLHFESQTHSLTIAMSQIPSGPCYRSSSQTSNLGKHLVGMSLLRQTGMHYLKCIIIKHTRDASFTPDLD